VYYLKGLGPYARLGLWVFLEYAFACASTTNQDERRSSAAHLLARWEHVHKEAVHLLYPYSRHSLQTQAPFNLSVKPSHNLERTQAIEALCLSKNLIS